MSDPNKDFLIDELLRNAEEEAKPKSVSKQMKERKPETKSKNTAPKRPKQETIERNTAPKKPTSKKRKKKKSKMVEKSGWRTFFWFIGILIVSLLIAGTMLLIVLDFLGMGKYQQGVVNIPKGSSTTQIASILKENKMIKFPLVYRLYSRIAHKDGTYQYGVYTVESSMGYPGISAKLQEESNTAAEVSVTIPDRGTVPTIAKEFENKKVTTQEKFIDAVQKCDYKFEFIKYIPKGKMIYNLEGYLLPETLNFYEDTGDDSGEVVVYRILQELDKFLTADKYVKAKALGYDMHQIMTMASIIELECSGIPEEMPNVAAVFYNRLNWKDQPNLLGSTPTQKYAEKYDDDRYDTNKTQGLPPGPLCSPSKNAIDAALNPTKDFEAVYFVTDAKGKFYYNKTLADHDETIRQLKNDDNWKY